LAGHAANAGGLGGLWQVGLAWPGAAKAAVAVAVVAAAAVGGYMLVPPESPMGEAPGGAETAGAPVVREEPDAPAAVAAADPVEADVPDTGPPVAWTSTFEAPPPV